MHRHLTLLVLAGLLAPARAGALPALTARFVLERNDGATYQGRFEVANAGSTVAAGWALGFDLPEGQTLVRVTEGTDATVGQHHTVAGQWWNAAVAPGATVGVGITVSLAGSYAAPTGCTIDGSPCGPAAAAPSVAGVPWGFAPYADMTLPATDLHAAKAAGVRWFSLAFVVAPSAGDCRPRWGGILEPGHPDVDVKLEDIRDATHDYLISFGGAAGIELAQACSSAEQLADAYRAVIDEYGVGRVDFDIEGAALADTAANARRGRAIAILQGERALEVTFTLPSATTGPTAEGIALLRTTVAQDADIELVNVMTMDYGPAQSAGAPGNMGELAISAASGTASMLYASGIFPGGSADDMLPRVGIIPMIGVNDTPGEVFDRHDARQVVEFAAQVGLGRLSMWSVARDRACAGGAPKPVADAGCSGIGQTELDFARVLNRYSGGVA